LEGLASQDPPALDFTPMPPLARGLLISQQISILRGSRWVFFDPACPCFQICTRQVFLPSTDRWTARSRKAP